MKTADYQVLFLAVRVGVRFICFFDQNIFREELSNIEKVKVLNKSIARIGFNTFVEKMYIEKGLRVWLS